MYIISSQQRLKNVTGAGSKMPDKNNDKPYVPQDPKYSPAGTFDNTQVKIYNGNEKYVHFGIEQQVTESLKITPNLVVLQDHGVHVPYGAVNFEYKWK